MSSDNKHIMISKNSGYIKKMTTEQKVAFNCGQKVVVPLDKGEKRHKVHYQKFGGETRIGIDEFKPYDRQELDFMRKDYRGEATQSVYIVQALHHGLMKNVVLPSLNQAALGLYKIQTDGFIQSTKAGNGASPEKKLNEKCYKSQVSFYIYLLNDNEEKARKAMERTQRQMVDLMVSFEEHPENWGVSDGECDNLREYLEKEEEDMSQENNYLKACNMLKDIVERMKELMDKFFGKIATQLATIIGDRTGELTMTHPFNNQELTLVVRARGEIAAKHNMMDWCWWKRLDTFKGCERLMKLIWQHYNWDIIKNDLEVLDKESDEEKEFYDKIVKDCEPNTLGEELKTMNRFIQLTIKGVIKFKRGEYKDVAAWMKPKWLGVLGNKYREIDISWYMWFSLYLGEKIVGNYDEAAKEFVEKWGMPGCRFHLLGEIEKFPNDYFHEL